MRFPELVAHRGWARNHPENTLCALESAIAAGARWLEVDVQLSSDGFPVLFHDRTLDRVCGVPGTIHDRTLAELRELSASEPGRFGDRFASEGVASLAGFAQLLLRRPEVKAFVEVKRVAIERFGTERVLSRVLLAIEPAIEQCALISFSLPFLALARAGRRTPLGAILDAWPEREQAAVRDLRPEYLFCGVESLPAAGPLDGGQARVAVWEVDDAQAALRLAARGVDLVETFAIGEMLGAFRELEAKPPSGGR